MASLTASLRKLEGLKTRADAELANADKALAAAKTDEAKAKAEDLKQKAAAKVADLATQLDTAKADAKSKLDAAAAAKDAAKAAEKRRPTPPRRQTRRSSRSSRSRSTSAARRRSYTCGATLISRRRTAAVRCSIRPLRSRSRSAIPTSGSARMCSRRWRATTRACAGARSRSTRRQRQGRARPHHHPAGRARSHRADRIAAILDRHLGRAAEQRDQLSHRVRRGAERPAAGWIHNAQAHGRYRVANDDFWDYGFGFSPFQPRSDSPNGKSAPRGGRSCTIGRATGLVVQTRRAARRESGDP